jgi:hypothetical protein
MTTIVLFTIYLIFVIILTIDKISSKKKDIKRLKAISNKLIFETLVYTKKLNNTYIKTFTEVQNLISDLTRLEQNDVDKNNIENCLKQIDSIKVDIEMKNVLIDDEISNLKKEGIDEKTPVKLGV